MSASRHERIPPITLGWRLKMALGDMSAQEMADQLGVSRGTISRWMADRGARPRRAYVLQWAMLTDTDVGWLESGKVSPGDPGQPGPDSRHTRPYADNFFAAA